MIKEYIDYMKDNPKGLWFKRKLYGWGWTPVKWQGWVVVLLAVALMVLNGLDLGTVGELTNSMITWFIIKLFVIVAVLIYICYAKGEKPRWQWGLDEKKD